MVVVSVTMRYQTPRRFRFERSFTIGTDPGCDVEVQLIDDRGRLAITVADPDVSIDPEGTTVFVLLNNYGVDKSFVHVLHVGDVLSFGSVEVLFELVAGTPVEVARVFGELSTAPDAAESEVLDALRADPADAIAREVYADWLDSHERCNEAELVRLQWLPDGKRVTDPAAFSSEWMSHQPRAIQLRLRDLAQLTDPARRALSSRPTMLCRTEGCPRRWEALEVGDQDVVRYCARCEGTVEFCSTFEAISTRGERRLPVAVDPILVLQAATRAYWSPDDDWDSPTNPVLEAFDPEDD